MERENDGEEKQIGFELDGKGGVVLNSDGQENRGWKDREVKPNYGSSELTPDKVEFEKNPENLVSFRKGTMVLGYSRVLDKYVKYYLQEESINAWKTDYKRNKMNCYCFDPEGPVEKASLYVDGHEEFLNEKHPFFFAYKRDERKRKKFLKQENFTDD